VWEPDWNGAVLTWEDAFTPVEHLDQALTHFRDRGALDHIAGMVVGELVICEPSGGVSAHEMVMDLCAEYDFPITFRLPFGHTPLKHTLPVGAEALLDSDAARGLTITSRGPRRGVTRDYDHTGPTAPVRDPAQAAPRREGPAADEGGHDARHASTEAGLIGRQAEHCPVLAATPLLDTLRLAKAVVPGLGSYGLDGLLGYYGIPKPAGRHRAMPDVEVTAQVLARLLDDGCAGGRWNTLLELDAVAGLQPNR
jgi:hypothetical protein